MTTLLSGGNISQSYVISVGNMAHVLLGWHVALDQGRYTWRYDSDVEIYCDAGGRPWTIPPDIVAASDKPELVIVKRKAKTVIIFELPVLYENNVQKTHQYTCYKCTHLVIDLLNLGLKVKFYAIDIGCRGLTVF